MAIPYKTIDECIEHIEKMQENSEEVKINQPPAEVLEIAFEGTGISPESYLKHSEEVGFSLDMLFISVISHLKELKKLKEK